MRKPWNDKNTFQRSRDDKNGKSDRKCFRCGDSNHLIGECPKPPKDKNQRSFVGGSWSNSDEEDDEKVKNETCLVAQASSEICLGFDLETDEWIKDSGCSKHLTGIQKILSSYKAYNGGNIIFGSNLRGNIIGKGTKWVFKNKLDENGIVSRNKARLVAQGYSQQKGINYDETYASVARLESIRILLAYASALDFKLFQMDVKSVFLNSFINEEFEMSMMGELNFFLRLQIKQMEDGIFFNQSKYIKEILKKFGLEESKPMKTPMSSDTKLTKDKECESVDSTKYRGMIGSLLYLTASRPDIMFSVCLCARFQEAPKISHLEAVKRIFQNIKGTTYLGLWYLKGTGIEAVVYADSGHAGDYV
ncbi:retrovirus-related pol polyprotein from transposon TNT 1-94 [Tanacetum coccineum]|uniref:Retrovirus-related pol polyprotein from transposon TNT 1-94 n=1 Tax=Tanacetum coccineum TaxID=301880 RepID=A0ABQ5JB00_9ASTR